MTEADVNAAPGASDSDGHSDGAQFHVRGSSASSVVVQRLMNSMPSWLLRTKGKLGSFLLSILRSPRPAKCSPAVRGNAPLWPMPIPYPEVFSSSATFDCDDWHLKRLVVAQVVAMNWISLGGPVTAPICLSLGTRLTAKQWSVVKYLEHLCVDGNTPNEIDASFMGRAAVKIESVERTLEALHRAIAFLKVEDNAYSLFQLSKPDENSSAYLAARAGVPCGKLSGRGEVTARPIVADRIKFPGPPCFNPGQKDS